MDCVRPNERPKQLGPTGGTIMAQSPRLCQAVVLPVLVVVLPRHSLRETIKRWYHPVSESTGGGTASIGSGTVRTRETRDETFLDLKFEST